MPSSGRSALSSEGAFVSSVLSCEVSEEACEVPEESADAPVSAVPVLRPIDKNKVTQMHTDPVGIESVWAAKSGYINLSLLLKAGKTDGEDAVQTLGLVDCGTTEGDDGKRMRHLKLYHDQGGVPEYYTVQRYASIDIKDLGDVDAVSITVNTYGGEVTKTFECNK